MLDSIQHLMLLLLVFSKNKFFENFLCNWSLPQPYFSLIFTVYKRQKFVGLPLGFVSIWSHWVASVLRGGLLLSRGPLGKCVLVILYVRLFLMVFRAHANGKETHSLWPQRTQGLGNPDKEALAWYNLSIKLLGDTQSEALNQDKLTELRKAHNFTLANMAPAARSSKWGTCVPLFVFIGIHRSTRCFNSHE